MLYAVTNIAVRNLQLRNMQSLLFSLLRFLVNFLFHEETEGKEEVISVSLNLAFIVFSGK